MNILLTGNKGFIGCLLEEKLKQLKYNVHGIDKKDGSDLLTCYLPYQGNFTAIIHLAGIGGVRESINEPAKYWQNNVVATERLLKKYQDTFVISASSSTAYEPWLNPYATTKFITEQIPHKNICHIRIHTTYSNTPRAGMFFHKLINNTLTYTTNHYRDFIHVEDTTSAIITLLQHKVKGIVDIGTGNSVEVRSLAPEYETRMGDKCERIKTCANIDLLKSLGWKPTIDVREFTKQLKKRPKLPTVDNNTDSW